MMGRAFILTLALCSGCFVEWTVGAYRTEQRSSKSGQAFELGFAVGTYLDSYKTPVAASYSGTHDRSRASTGDISRYRNNDQQVRVDYTLGKRETHLQPGVVGALRWGLDSTLTLGDPGGEKMRTLSSQYTAFAGFSYRYVLPGYVWNDALTVAIGPAIQRFDTELGGEFRSTGAQLRLSAQLSPLLVLGVLGGGDGSFWARYHPTPIKQDTPAPDYKPNICSPNNRDINCK
jgi:hypothetical protein